MEIWSHVKKYDTIKMRKTDMLKEKKMKRSKRWTCFGANLRVTSPAG